MDKSLSAVLVHEHHEIDAGIEAFLAGLSLGETRMQELTRAVEALRRHIYLEEEFLFPPLRAAGMIPPVLVMLREHGEIWRTLDAIQILDPDADREGARERCGELLAQLASHNAKEEPIIYPQGDAVLTDEAKRDLRGFIDSGRMPQAGSAPRPRPGVFRQIKSRARRTQPTSVHPSTWLPHSVRPCSVKDPLRAGPVMHFTASLGRCRL